jgi:DNA-binding NarL/FixJ family response regulator
MQAQTIDILVAERFAPIRELIARSFDNAKASGILSLNARIIYVEDAEHALRKLGNPVYLPSAVVSSYQLTEAMNGILLLQHVRRNFPVKHLFLLADHEHPDVKALVAKDKIEYLLKNADSIKTLPYAIALHSDRSC